MRPLAYGSASFAYATLQSLFLTFHIPLFVNVHALATSWFLVGQAVFLLCNSVYDPLFGFLVRRLSARRRVKMLRIGGSLWCVTFAVFFFVSFGQETPKWMVGLTFAIGLLVYVSCLSFVLILHNSLLPDVCSSAEERTSCNASTATFSMLGSCSVFAANLFWDQKNLVAFRYFCVGMAALSLLAVHFSSSLLLRYMHPEADRGGHDDGDVIHLLEEGDEHLSIWNFWPDLQASQSFWIFVSTNFIQMFNCHLNTSFLVISLAIYLLPVSSPMAVSLVLALSAILPHVFVVLLAPLIRLVGLSKSLLGMFSAKACVGLLGLLFVSPLHATMYELCVLFLLNKVSTEVICRHCNLVVADLVESDAEQRPANFLSRSSLFYGANAFFAKPGQALAAVFGYFAFKEGGSKIVLFRIYFLVPVVCGAIQIVIFSFFPMARKNRQNAKEMQLRKENAS